jgi:hypothetical protein
VLLLRSREELPAVKTRLRAWLWPETWRWHNDNVMGLGCLVRIANDQWAFYILLADTLRLYTQILVQIQLQDPTHANAI